MRLTEYQTGDCGAGYFYAIITVVILVAVAFVPLMGVTLSWVAVKYAGAIDTLVWALVMTPYVYPFWALGTLALIPGILAAFTSSYVFFHFRDIAFRSKQRILWMNIWILTLIMFVIATLVSGGYFAWRVYKDVDLPTNLVKAIKGVIQEGAEKKGLKPGKSLKKVGTAAGDIWDRSVDIASSMMWYYFYQKAEQYSLKSLIFLYWQRPVTVLAFLVIPSLLAIWATVHAMGLRNYFATDPKQYRDVTVAEGDQYETYEDDSDESFNDSSDEDESNQSEGSSAAPDRFSSQITVVQEEDRRGRHTRRAV